MSVHLAAFEGGWKCRDLFVLNLFFTNICHCWIAASELEILTIVNWRLEGMLPLSIEVRRFETANPTTESSACQDYNKDLVSKFILNLSLPKNFKHSNVSKLYKSKSTPIQIQNIHVALTTTLINEINKFSHRKNCYYLHTFSSHTHTQNVKMSSEHRQ